MRTVHLRSPRRVLSIALAAVALSACGASTSVADVVRTGAPVDAPSSTVSQPPVTTAPSTPTSTVPATGAAGGGTSASSGSTPWKTRADDEAYRARFLEARDLLVESGWLPGLADKQEHCVVLGMYDAFGADRSFELLSSFADGEPDATLDEVATAAHIAGTCVDAKATVIAMANRAFFTFGSESSCAADALTPAELEAVLGSPLIAFGDRTADTSVAHDRWIGELGRCMTSQRVQNLIMRAAITDDDATVAQAECYAARRVAGVSPADAMRLEFGSTHTIPEAAQLVDAMLACLDVRASFARGYASGSSEEIAQCVAQRLGEADLRTLLTEFVAHVDLGRDSAVAHEHLRTTDAACRAGRGGA